MSLLLVEVDGLFHPSLEGGGNLFHEVDHGGDLGIQSFSEESVYGRGVTCLGLSHQVLEFGEICLETIILLSGSLFQGLKFISSSFIHMEWIEHVSKHLFYDVEVFVSRFDVFVHKDA